MADEKIERLNIGGRIRANVIPIVNVVAVCAMFGVPIWFGSWYPGAQVDLNDANYIKAMEFGPLIKSQLKVPDFLQVCRHHVFDHESPPLYVIFSLIFIVLTQWNYFSLSNGAAQLKLDYAQLQDERKDLHTRVNDEQEAHSDTRQLYYDSLKDHVERFCEKTEGYREDKCRVSIYRIDKEADRARLIFRCCAISRYENKGRVSIPLGEGVLGATVQNGDSTFVTVGQKRYAANIKRALAEYGVAISESTLSTIKMKSLTYYGRALRNSSTSEKIAILILESLEEKAFSKQELDAIFERQKHDFAGWVENIARLDQLLNPYGG